LARNQGFPNLAFSEEPERHGPGVSEKASMTAIIRHPAVAGRFYPGDPRDLGAAIDSYCPAGQTLLPAIGCVVPHAGYMYSGQVAGAVYSGLEVPQRCIVLCPNHTGKGPPLSIMSRGTWETPLGAASIDQGLGDALRDKFPLLMEDTEAHRNEHAIEVQIPFLQMRRPDFTFVPLVLGTGNFEVLEGLGNAIGELLAAQPEPVLIIASSDMNHYENDSITRGKDHKAIGKILALDAPGLFDVVTREKISMCGFGPAVTMLTAAQHLGATEVELVRYATSGDVSGDREMVVGYAGIVVRRAQPR
jgi:MEMO1 family protein